MSENAELIEFLVGPDADPHEAAEYVKSLQRAPLETIESILRVTLQNLEPIVEHRPSILGSLLQLLQTNLLGQPRAEALQLDSDLIVAFYENLPPSVDTRFVLLHALSIAGGSHHLTALCNLLQEDPPQSWVQTGLVLSPLFQRDHWQVDDVFPMLLDSLEHTAVAGGIIDLANNVTRRGKTEIHPGEERLDQLISLLEALVSRLEKAEKNPATLGDSVEQINKTIGEAIALVVSLCDALALIEDEKALPSLEHAMELTHRRIQTEAAGALARFGKQEGIDRLISLVSEPSARLRVLAYCEELELTDKIDERYRTPESQAESELALWLAQPSQMSVPPGDIVLLDSRVQFWPGYEEPVQCYLFRFEYSINDRVFANLAIVGPITHAFSSDLTKLEVDDAYASFAGWQAEHDDIFIVAKDEWNTAQTEAVAKLAVDLDKDGFQKVKPEFLGFFLGEHALVCVASQDEKEGVCVTDGLESIWFPSFEQQNSLSLLDVWNVYKGRKMLRTFNA